MQLNQTTPIATDPLFSSVGRFCEDRDMSKATFYRLVKAGKIRPVKSGSRTLVPRAEARRHDQSLPILSTAA
jgi:excisionase family DNA binding protein